MNLIEAIPLVAIGFAAGVVVAVLVPKLFGLVLTEKNKLTATVAADVATAKADVTNTVAKL